MLPSACGSVSWGCHCKACAARKPNGITRCVHQWLKLQLYFRDYFLNRQSWEALLLVCGFGQPEIQALSGDCTKVRLQKCSWLQLYEQVLNAFLWEKKQTHSVTETGWLSAEHMLQVVPGVMYL